ncbi:uncharacterized protein WM294_005388 [Sarcoramphus papa]
MEVGQLLCRRAVPQGPSASYIPAVSKIKAPSWVLGSHTMEELLFAPSHCSLNLAIMRGSLRRPSICGTSMQPDGLPSSSSIFPAMLVHPFGSGAAAHVLLVASALPPRIPALSSQKPFVLGCSQASGGSAWSRRPSRAWGGFKEVIGVHCTEKSTLFCSK